MKFITIPLSIIFRLIVFLRNTLYNNGIFAQKELDSIVISIGNLSTGGTGKTPFVELVAQYLLNHGKFVAIIAKGYLREADDIKVIEVGYDNSNHKLNTESIGDEAFVLLENIKSGSGRGLIVIGDDKTKTAKFVYAKFKPEIIIIDDGFQHRNISRDLDILIIDGNESKHMIPAGNLREPYKNKARADLIVINEKFGGPKIIEKTGISLPAVCYYEIDNFYNINYETTTPDGKTVIAFCGIGDPGSFKDLLISKNIAIAKFLPFADHHNFSPDEISAVIVDFEASGAELIITTQKDFFRLKNTGIVLESASDNIFRQLIYKTPIYYPKIKTTFRKNDEELYSHLDKVVKIVE